MTHIFSPHFLSAGKTFVAAVVMYNYLALVPAGQDHLHGAHQAARGPAGRELLRGKSVGKSVVRQGRTQPSLAPSGSSPPLLSLQAVGIPLEEQAVIMGGLAPSSRAQIWREKRVFFCTPQVGQSTDGSVKWKGLLLSPLSSSVDSALFAPPPPPHTHTLTYRRWTRTSRRRGCSPSAW